MILRRGVPVLSGLLTGAIAGRWAVLSVAAGSPKGGELLVVVMMWAVGVVTTAFGAGGFAFYGIALAQLSQKSANPHQLSGKCG